MQSWGGQRKSFTSDPDLPSSRPVHQPAFAESAVYGRVHVVIYGRVHVVMYGRLHVVRVAPSGELPLQVKRRFFMTCRL